MDPARLWSRVEAFLGSAARIVSVYLVLMSLGLYGLMVWDKKAARRRARRTPERTLLGFAIAGGALGGWLAMAIHRHKTRHLRFRLVFPMMTLVWAIIVFVLWFGRWPSF